jgi:predicted GNAT family acetyltransferase
VASVEHSQAVMVALDATGALVGTYYLRPNSLALGAHVANAGYVVATWARRRGIGSRLCQHSLQAARRLGLRRCLGGVPGPGAGAEAMKVVPLRRTWIEQPYGEEEITLLEEEVIPAIQPASTSYLTLTPSRNGSGLTAACRSEEQTAWLVEVAKQAQPRDRHGQLRPRASGLSLGQGLWARPRPAGAANLAKAMHLD